MPDLAHDTRQKSAFMLREPMHRNTAQRYGRTTSPAGERREMLLITAHRTSRYAGQPVHDKPPEVAKPTDLGVSCSLSRPSSTIVQRMQDAFVAGASVTDVEIAARCSPLGGLDLTLLPGRRSATSQCLTFSGLSWHDGKGAAYGKQLLRGLRRLLHLRSSRGSPVIAAHPAS